MLLHSGYNHVPKRKMLWEMKPDCQNLLVSGAIRRDQVDQVLQCLHFRDNTLLDGDGYFKVRPIFNNLNKSSKWFLESGQYSVDEVMIPYYGRHGSKQFMHGKPIRHGYKVSNKFRIKSSHT
jgi:DNA excision repair protein ERCC-6